MRIVMLGTGPFAVPTFCGLFEAGHEVAALVTRPSKAQPGRPAPPNPMRDEAERRGVTVFSPETVNAPDAQQTLRAWQPDLLVVCDYGEILKPETLAVARLGGINLHASLLPKYRGAAPINWAIYHGEAETGDTVIHMTPGLDAGPIIALGRTPIGAEETAGELEIRLAQLGAPLVQQAIVDLATGRAQPLVQDKSQATKAPRLKKTDGEIDWSRSARQLQQQVRAFQPWPQSYTFWQRAGREPLRLIVGRVAVEGTTSAAPGCVVESSGRLMIATGDGVLELLEVQPAGKRMLAAVEFLRGYPLQPGDRLG